MQQPAAKPAPGPATSEKKTLDPSTRNNALALLDDLLGDEKNLSKILIIKKHSDKLAMLLKTISKTAASGAELTESIAKSEPGLDLKNTALPRGEIATRKAIAKAKEQVLLQSKGSEFEFQLLLTQTEALNYGANLAVVIAENESRPENARRFLMLSSQLRDLHEQVLAMIRAQPLAAK